MIGITSYYIFITLTTFYLLYVVNSAYIHFVYSYSFQESSISTKANIKSTRLLSSTRLIRCIEWKKKISKSDRKINELTKKENILLIQSSMLFLKDFC